ncbi:hypothetical protein [Noviherbaspirillum aerium]|uniref:hypothetical protein n=1 Tax=Noviherbaspirillum aerium TaxID=2588497 RepID=UPI00124D34E7|nr:hypothetical protein [Noviherbaspirillum aerium]
MDKHLTFNGDFNWFNIDDASFARINETVSSSVLVIDTSRTTRWLGIACHIGKNGASPLFLRRTSESSQPGFAHEEAGVSRGVLPAVSSNCLLVWHAPFLIRSNRRLVFITTYKRAGHHIFLSYGQFFGMPCHYR